MTAGRLHYRSLDVTALQWLADATDVSIPQSRGLHRAVPDVEDAIHLAKSWTDIAKSIHKAPE